ncbi:MAG: hypothetical protein BJ554DRAFT_3547 [Olpidium bornovanus]|uniref:Uncharacterized protein n=1 Tax=Olpidium bornovanus TaxID=278681 RepID=A0A8H8DFR1_9FUNG|nr:MAG: hypothetical protein BJ554DRAFT_3547 [Olpidium bornovanus]
MLQEAVFPRNVDNIMAMNNAAPEDWIDEEEREKREKRELRNHYRQLITATEGLPLPCDPENEPNCVDIALPTPAARPKKKLGQKIAPHTCKRVRTISLRTSGG